MELNYTPHPAQQVIHDARGTRFRTVCCGRRFGKTLLAAAELLDCAALQVAGDYAWIAPTYWTAERGVEALRMIAPGLVRFKGQNPVVGLFDGPLGECRFIFCSTDNPDSIPGLGFHGIVLDECAQVEKRTYDIAIRPTISQTAGWQLAISTPRGRNWFYDLHTRGFDAAETDYKSFIFPSDANPFFPPGEMGEARRTLPEDVYKQEYLAEFLEDSAGVFRGVTLCLVPDTGVQRAECLASGARRVVVGLDVAKHTDWTVMIAMDAMTGACLDMARFHQIDWPFQRERIVEFVRRWNAQLVMDATGVGDPIYDDLTRALPCVEGVKISSASKRELVQGLMVAIEQRLVSWPAGNRGQRTEVGGQATGDDWEVLTGELQRYEYALGPTGQVFYSAPSGFHDDCVMALALAQRGRLRFGMRPGAMARIPLVNDGGGRAADGREVGSGYVIGGRRNPRLGGRRVRFLG